MYSPGVVVSAKRYESGKKLRVDWVEPYVAPLPTKLYVVLDWKEVSIAYSDGVRTIVKYTDESTIAGKHNKGGMSQQRMERNHDIAVLGWFSDIEDVVSGLVRSHETTEIIVGGPGMSKNSWISSVRDQEIRKRLRTTTYNTGYTDDSQGIKELVAYSG